ncbi:hypothetical protein, partial [Nonomuraea lactucae]|uniref:hypothetical protein n=1 Tax=Nonomuraea lactucae TaxID=2249762 RepID=UPI0019627664
MSPLKSIRAGRRDALAPVAGAAGVLMIAGLGVFLAFGGTPRQASEKGPAFDQEKRLTGGSGIPSPPPGAPAFPTSAGRTSGSGSGWQELVRPPRAPEATARKGEAPWGSGLPYVPVPSRERHPAATHAGSSRPGATHDGTTHDDPTHDGPTHDGPTDRGRADGGTAHADTSHADPTHADTSRGDASRRDPEQRADP